jgi:ribosomal protein S18 acetylase RimI-like enzyme
MNIKIRQTNADEVAKVLALFEESALILREKGTTQWQHWINPTPALINRVQKGVAEKDYFFVEKSRQLAGMFRLMNSDEEYWGVQTEAAVYLHSFLTRPAFKGQNIGSTVLKSLEIQVRERGIRYFRLDCIADNVALCNYYENQGFTRIRKQKVPHYEVQLFEKKLTT